LLVSFKKSSIVNFAHNSYKISKKYTNFQAKTAGFGVFCLKWFCCKQLWNAKIDNGPGRAGFWQKQMQILAQKKGDYAKLAGVLVLRPPEADKYRVLRKLHRFSRGE